eukprot:gene14179-16717_t
MESIKQAHLRSLDNLERGRRADEIKQANKVVTQKSFYVSSSLSSNAKKPTRERIVYDVVGFLRDQEGNPATLEEIMVSTGHNIAGQPDLIESLKLNPKIEFLDANTVAFKPKYKVTNPKDIVELLSNEPHGVLMSELKESYQSVAMDVKRLRDAKEIYVVKNTESNTDVLFYNDEKYRVPVHQSFIDMWHNISVPNDVDLAAEMKSAGLSMVETSETVKITKSTKVKKDRKKRITKVTNVHIQNFDPNAIFTPPPKTV